MPKTIDNDVPLIDYTFGFGTAVSKAVDAIHAAFDEAVAYPNGVGIVNLMGRNSGFIAAHATIGARGVDVCLVPEVPFELDGPQGLLRCVLLHTLYFMLHTLHYASYFILYTSYSTLCFILYAESYSYANTLRRRGFRRRRTAS